MLHGYIGGVLLIKSRPGRVSVWFKAGHSHSSPVHTAPVAGRSPLPALQGVGDIAQHHGWAVDGSGSRGPRVDAAKHKSQESASR